RDRTHGHRRAGDPRSGGRDHSIRRERRKEKRRARSGPGTHSGAPPRGEELMIVRIWRGHTRSEDAESYTEFIEKTGSPTTGPRREISARPSCAARRLRRGTHGVPRAPRAGPTPR